MARENDEPWWLDPHPESSLRYSSVSSLEDQAAVIKKALVSSLNTWQIKRQLKEEVLRYCLACRLSETKPQVDLDSLLSSSGLDTKLKNSIYKLHRQAINDSPAIPDGLSPSSVYCADRLDFVEKAKLKWERRIRLELDAMAAEMGVPLRRGKDEPRRHPDHSEQAIRFVYDDNDLLDVLSNISNPNRAATTTRVPSLCLIKVELAVMDMAEVRSMFQELDPTRRKSWTAADDDGERIKLFQRVTDVGYIPDVRQHAKRGVPQAARPKVWQKILGVDVGEAERVYFQRILDSLREWELVTDELFRLDVSLMASDDHYFVFEDMLADCMAVFSRDPWLSRHAVVQSQANERSLGDQARQELVFPPCGVVPFRGIAMYAAPLCFLYSDAPHLYLTFRAIYANYYCRLNTVSSQPGSILHLARQFECLLLEACPDLFFHLTQVGAVPLRLVFSWLFFGFAGALEVDQVLAVWDLVLAWDSLVVLPLLAAAIISFRQRRLRQCVSLEEAQDALSDCSRLKAVPIIQLFLHRNMVASLEAI